MLSGPASYVGVWGATDMGIFPYPSHCAPDPSLYFSQLKLEKQGKLNPLWPQPIHVVESAVMRDPIGRHDAAPTDDGQDQRVLVW
jgi:hypothetical protein